MNKAMYNLLVVLMNGDVTGLVGTTDRHGALQNKNASIINYMTLYISYIVCT